MATSGESTHSNQDPERERVSWLRYRGLGDPAQFWILVGMFAVVGMVYLFAVLNSQSLACVIPLERWCPASQVLEGLRELNSAMTVGMNQRDFTQRLIPIKKQYDQITDWSERDRPIKEAVEVYLAVAKLWDEEIRHASRYRHQPCGSDMSVLTQLAKKYSVVREALEAYEKGLKEKQWASCTRLYEQAFQGLFALAYINLGLARQ